MDLYLLLLSNSFRKKVTLIEKNLLNKSWTIYVSFKCFRNIKKKTCMDAVLNKNKTITWSYESE